ncbi:MAG: BON domain-containing protein [Alphaproteobacteria bacterium]|nr:BON domain-containing protein [Alphaproteobacteria bacterium]
MYRILLLAALLPALTACFTVVSTAVTETGITIAEDRSFGSRVDDNVIYAEINQMFLEKDVNDLLVNVTINVRHKRVMLTGNAKTEETAQEAVRLAWQAKGVQEVINEVEINPNSSLWDSANDSLIKKNLEARYLITKGVWVINYSIDVVNGTVYLLGITHNREELDKVLEVARATKGVKKVVSHLKVGTQMPAKPELPASNYSTSTVPQDAPIQSKQNF